MKAEIFHLIPFISIQKLELLILATDVLAFQFQTHKSRLIENQKSV